MSKRENIATANFVLRGVRVTVDFELSKLNPEPYMSLTGTMEGGGQIQGRLREQGEDFAEVITLCDLWDAHHMKKPTAKAQTAIKAALEALEGNRYGTAGDVSDAPDVSESDDTIDSRDVIRRIEAYREALEAAGIDPDEVTTKDFDPESRPDDGADILELLEEYEALKELEDEAEGYAPDWRYGETLIRDSYFEDYARELADDCGMTNKDSKWPNNHIDWAAAAEELQGDYTAVTFKGVTYWIR